MKKWLSFALSFLLHSLILLSIYVSPLREKNSDQKIYEDIEISYLKQNSNLEPQAASSKGDKRLRAFSTFSAQFFKKTSVGEALHPTPSGFEESRTYTLQQEGETHPFFTALYQRIDMMLAYPNALSEGRIHGSAIIDFTVNERGEIQPWFDIISSDHPFLETYMIAVLVSSLKSPLPKNLWAKEKKYYKLALKTDFKLLIKGSGEQAPAEQFKKNRNVFFITKTATVEPIANVRVNDFFEHVFPPVIIPLPGAAMIDFYGIYKFIREHSKPDFDERSKRRIEADLETWTKFIKENAPPKKS